MALPTDYDSRKALQMFTFLTEYFPDAIEELVQISVAGNAQHGNVGNKIYWARDKSMDQMNTAFRHMWDHGRGSIRDTDGRLHIGKAAWRALAECQLTIEKERAMAAYAASSDKYRGALAALGARPVEHG